MLQTTTLHCLHASKGSHASPGFNIYLLLKTGIRKDPETWITSLYLYKLSLPSPPSHSILSSWACRPAAFTGPFPLGFGAHPHPCCRQQGCIPVAGIGRVKTEHRGWAVASLTVCPSCPRHWSSASFIWLRLDLPSTRHTAFMHLYLPL